MQGGGGGQQYDSENDIAMHYIMKSFSENVAGFSVCQRYKDTDLLTRTLFRL